MLYRTIDKTGDELSILGFGCMRLPGSDIEIDEERADKQIRYAIDRGVNYIDTAFPYHMGKCEPFLGRALADGYREKVKLATKMPPWVIDSFEVMGHVLDSHLERLKTEYIDYYLIYSLDRKIWENMKDLGVLNFLDIAKEDKRIINTGFSFHGEIDVFKEIIDAYD